MRRSSFEGGGWVTFTGSEPGKVSSNPSSRASSSRLLSASPDFVPDRVIAPSANGRSADRLADSPTMVDDSQSGNYKKVRENVHEAHHLHRGSARGSPAKGAQGIFRLRRSRLLFRGHVARQPRRPAADKVSPTYPGRRVEARSLDHHPRGAGRAAADPGADWADGHAI